MTTEHLLSKVVLFEKEKNGTVYRIPSLLYLDRDGIFLAFAEKRSSPRDLDAKTLVMRRGTFQGGSVKWQVTVELETARLTDFRSMNPCPVYERQQAAVYLFFNCVKEGVSESWQLWHGKNAARLCYVRSLDAGLTWSPLVDLTEEVIGEQISRWGTFSVSPGHGVQTACGMLVVPAYAYIISCRSCLLPPWFFTWPHPFYFFSKDGGVSWKMGQSLTEYRAGECELAEVTIANTKRLLYCNARTDGCARVEAISQDLGYFKIAHLTKELPECNGGCQGSVASFHRPAATQALSHAGDRVSWLLYTHPSGEWRMGRCKHNRTNLGVYLNPWPLQRCQWRGPWVIQAGPCGYSDLVYLESAATFACLYECGEHVFYQQIVFCLFTVKQVMKNIF
ncbi:sialidase-3-like [Narcine bancroftii]|uniref:sialidase-3-like n=1 Tax=Narcine bancroftii TaxID=1343680 RepID=UPI0038320769